MAEAVVEQLSLCKLGSYTGLAVFLLVVILLLNYSVLQGPG